MPKRKKKSKLADSTLLEDSKNSKLTADLPSRTRRRKKRKSYKVLPVIIILLAGIIGFLIPTLSRTETGSESLSSGLENENTSIDQNNEKNTEEPNEPEVVYETKEFAVVEPNDVGYLNVRADATINSQRIGRLDIGDKLEVVDKTSVEGWVKVTLEEPLEDFEEAWISADYVELVTEQVPVEG